MHAAVRQRVLTANLDLAARGLAHASFGNVSEIDHDAHIVAKGLMPSAAGLAFRTFRCCARQVPTTVIVRCAAEPAAVFASIWTV